MDWFLLATAAALLVLVWFSHEVNLGEGLVTFVITALFVVVGLIGIFRGVADIAHKIGNGPGQYLAPTMQIVLFLVLAWVATTIFDNRDPYDF